MFPPSLLRSLLFLSGLILIQSSVDAADYLKDIKPLFEHKCYACHGSLKQQGGLRLDTAKSLLQGGDSGVTVTPEKVDESLLLGVLTGDAGFRMPPENEGAPLSDAEIQLVREWVRAGAPQPENEEPQADPNSWWSYTRLIRPESPAIGDLDWCRNEIDRFVEAKRTELGLPHTVEAAPDVWLRRVYLDLIGLPPTREERHSFLANQTPDAYERVVDDLLSRPQYGERWGRHWMDIWRYSDWYGSRGINEIRYSQRHIWRWRDWIVSSLNQGKGYDQMLRAMLAADELPETDVDSLPATGYLGRSWYKFDRNVWLFETVERTGEAFLGMTLRCCRCHDHKFDPISQEEYYRFRAFFEPHEVRTDPLLANGPTVKDATLGQVLQDGIPLVYDKNLDVPTYLFQRGDSRYPDESKPLIPGVPAALGGEASIKAIDLPVTTWYPSLRQELRDSLLADSERSITTAKQSVQERVEALSAADQQLAIALTGTETPQAQKIFLHDTFNTLDTNLWEALSGDWNSVDGKLTQSAVTSFATIVTKAEHPEDFSVQLRYRPLSPGTYRSVGFSFDYQDQGNSQDIYTSTGDKAQSVQAFHRKDGKQVYPSAGIVMTPLKVGEEATLDVMVTGSNLTIDLNGVRKLDYEMPEQRQSGRFALWVHQGAAEFIELKITRLAASKETLEKNQQLAATALQVAKAELKAVQAEAISLQQRLEADRAKYAGDDEQLVSALAGIAASAERSATLLRCEVDVLKSAGNEKDLLAATEKLTKAREALASTDAAYSAVGTQYPSTSTGRRTALANWLTHDENPRTARVAVNHLWGRHFGRPLVATPENFGLNGRQPTHPELLDWLAAELVFNNWRMKPLHRQIVLSATYRMTTKAVFSDPPTQGDTKSAAVSNDAENKFLWRMHSKRMEAEVVRDSVLYTAGRLDLKLGGPEIPESNGEKILRRSLYFRNTPNEKMEMLEVFDVADPNACYRRKESVIPHQSLALMNSGLTIDCARLVAEQLRNEPDFISAAFEAILSRAPTQQEATRCQDFLNNHTNLLKTPQTQLFPGGGTATSSSAADPAMRARENLIHVLFLHNDFVTIR